MYRVVILQFLLSLFLSRILLAQTGPGGVGKTDGTSDLVLWLDANKVSATNNTVVKSWNDMSGYGYHFNSGNGATYKTNIVNTYPVFSFDGSTNYFERVYTAKLSTTTFSVFSASNVTSSGNYKAVISNRNDLTATNGGLVGFVLYSVPTSNNWEFWTGPGTASWNVTASGVSTAGTWAGQQMLYSNTSNGKQLSISDASPATNTNTLTANAAMPIRVGTGRNESTPDYYFNGLIGEVIMYKTVVNTAQAIIINNYLSAKYGYSLSANDLYVQDNAANGNYDHDVAGIGRIDASNIQNDSRGTGIVEIKNPTNLTDNKFLLWGHDGGKLAATETTDIPSTVKARVKRVWRVSEVNASGSAVSVGNIDVSWDLSGLGPVTASDLRLLIDTDNDGLFSDETPIAGASLVSGSVYQFSAVSAIANNLRFTLATINKNQTPIPVKLISFNASAAASGVVTLSWQTASENNNAYFAIERSTNGTDWKETGRVTGAGNSNEPLFYSYTDANPGTGILYYRLRQTDFDGHAEYSPVRIVNITTPTAFELYPNPASAKLMVRGYGVKASELVLSDISGRNITSQVSCIQNGETEISINLQQIPPGIYVVKWQNTARAFLKSTK